jgi:hypothetical protein
MSENPIILSFDVGIINLAYCMFSKINNQWSIIDWSIINLSNRTHTKCYCGLKACFTHNNNYYCKVHSKKIETLKSFEELFINNTENTCCYPVKNNVCNKKSCFFYDNNYYCKTHGKSKYKTLTTLHKLKPFKNKPINGYDFDELRLKLLEKLHEKKELLKADIILIENQPSMINPVMKSISNGIYDFYMIRGFIDKIENCNIKKVKFMCPSNKLKVVESGDVKKISIMKKTDESKAYKLTKSLAVKYTKDLISHLPNWLEYLNKEKKQDDLCDCFLQGCYYYEKTYN